MSIRWLLDVDEVSIDAAVWRPLAIVVERVPRGSLPSYNRRLVIVELVVITITSMPFL